MRPVTVLLCVVTLVNLGIFFATASGNDFPTAEVKGGKLRGVYLKSRGGKTYSAFMGIPYANKAERFELAEPVSAWEGVKDASKFGSVCSQFNIVSQQFEGSEDCLFANVFTPDIKGNFPVVVFIHGGGFYFGNSNENGGDYFADEPVILVTINYRLSVFGFLSTQDSVLPGNLGLKDQLLALKWVQENIKFFGGDSARTTLMGESAGAASVSFHILSEASKGLFRSAICLSGSALNPWSLPENPKQVAYDIADKLGCPKDSKGLKECLRSKGPEEIVESTRFPTSFDRIVILGPTVEPPSSHAILTERPEKLYKEGKFQQVPLLMTITEKEGLLINAAAIVQNEQLTKDFNENWSARAPFRFYYDHPDASQDALDLISKRIKKFYFNDQPISKETLDNLANVYSDSFFVYGVRNQSLLHAKYAPVYTVLLAYDKMPFSQIMNFGYDKSMGMTHADDLPVLFSAEKYANFEPNSEPEMVSKYFIKSVVSVATNLNPNHENVVKGWNPVSKKEIETGNLKWLFVKKIQNLEFIEEPIAERMRFWDKVNKKLKSSSNKGSISKKEEL